MRIQIRRFLASVIEFLRTELTHLVIRHIKRDFACGLISIAFGICGFADEPRIGDRVLESEIEIDNMQNLEMVSEENVVDDIFQKLRIAANSISEFDATCRLSFYMWQGRHWELHDLSMQDFCVRDGHLTVSEASLGKVGKDDLFNGIVSYTRSISSGELYVNSYKVLRGPSAVEFLELLNSQNLLSFVISHLDFDSGELTLVLDDHGTKSPLVLFDVFPWTGVLSWSEQSVVGLIDRHEVTGWYKAKFQDFECFGVLATNAIGDFDLCVCPDLNNCIVKFVLKQNSGSSLNGKQLLKSHIRERLLKIVVRDATLNSCTMEALSIQSFVEKDKSDSKLFIRNEIQNFITDKNRKTEFALDVPNGIRVHRTGDPQIWWEWRNGDVVKAVDLDIIDAMEHAKLRLPKTDNRIFVMVLILMVVVTFLPIFKGFKIRDRGIDG